MKKIIPLLAGSITISNFIFSLIPVTINPPQWYQTILQCGTGVKFILLFILLFVVSYVINRLLIELYKFDCLPSLKFSLTSVLTVSFAWMLIFNIKGFAFTNNLDTLNTILLFITVGFFYIYNNISTHYDIKHLKLNPKPSKAGLWPDDTNHNPVYLRVLRFVLFWITVLYGTFYFNF